MQLHNQNVFTRLRALRDDIENTTAVDEKTKGRLMKVRDEIQRALPSVQHETALPDSGIKLSETLEEAVEDFRDGHPRLAKRIQDTVAALTNAGL